ncbi:MAG: DNA-protecting protein DprA [Ruminococcaceae bacterium]|nr:DNA-protecting protein DprA [Oscillospiraceae bacterium]
MENSCVSDVSWIWASRLGRPINDIVGLLETEYGSIETAYEMARYGELTESVSVNKKLKERLLDKGRIDEAEKIHNKAIKSGMRIIKKCDNSFPEYLKEISCAPVVLYCYGKLPSEISTDESVKMPLLAVVGARNCSAYGYGVSLKFSRILSAFGIGIVSGMARGVDSAAHKGALSSDGYTVAVLGCGADVVYPSENRHLYNEIKDKGCIISEFLPGSEPVRNHFPARNRIIAGMSQAVTVIEAGETSGAMITAGLAGDMGRDVYAVPGNIDSTLSYGANKLIQNGALCVMSCQDILSEMGIGFAGRISAEYQSYECPALSNDDEKSVYRAVAEGHHDLNFIQLETGISFGKLRSVLGVLEINGLVSRNYDGFYYLTGANTR